MEEGFVKKGLQKLMTVSADMLSLSFLKKRAGIRLFLPFYHVVSDQYLPHISHLYSYSNIESFKQALELLLKHFKPLSLEEISTSGSSKNPAGFHLTFDDGLREMHEIAAPILKEKGIPATFFVNNNFIDNKELFYRFKVSLLIEELHANKGEKMRAIQSDSRFSKDFEGYLKNLKYGDEIAFAGAAKLLEVDYPGFLQKHQPYMTSRQITELIRQGFTIGAHSLDHPRLSDLSPEEQDRQCAGSVKRLRQKFGLHYGAFAFPFTDAGIKSADFERLISNPEIDLFFGGAAGREESSPKVYQRFSMERNGLKGENLLKYAFMLHWVRKLTRQNKVKRY